MKKKIMQCFLCLWVLLGVLSFPFVSSADEVYTFIVKKQEEKSKNRWSLSEWLETRDKMRLMDLWLVLHSPSPYEFYLQGDYRLWEKNPGAVSQNGFGIEGAAYASLFGLQGSYQSYSDFSRLQALFRLRIFGFHVQSTNIILGLGLKSQQETSTFRNFVLGGEMTLYFAKFFGVDGGYWHDFDSTPAVSGEIVSGGRWNIGAFIDFKFFRVFGKYVRESEDRAIGGVTQNITRAGPLFGGRFFF